MKTSVYDSFNHLFSSYKEGLSVEGGFLPYIVPGSSLPSSFDYYLEILSEVPEQLSPYNGISIRKWLDKKLSQHEHQYVSSDIDKLNYGQLNNALSILSILMQSYRWDMLPAKSSCFSIEKLSFPDELYFPWKKISDRIGLPYANTYWSVIACNWKLKSIACGERYKNENLISSNFEILYTWLPKPYHNELEEFILSFVEMEARGSLAIRAIIESIGCAIHGNDKGVIEQLVILNNHIKMMGSTFNKRIKKNKISLENWRDVIHVPFAWGLTNENGEKLEGASGMQVGAIAALNAFLSIPETSNIGKATRNSRIYLLPKQRVFLSKLDDFQYFMKEYVMKSNNLDMINAFNSSVESLLRWRISHQKRGEIYLSHNVKDDTPQIATGLTLPQNGNQVHISDLFVQDMEERIQETKSSKIEAT